MVTATILYVETIGNKEQFAFSTLLGKRTDELGKCTIGHHLPNLAGYILVLKVTVADMATITVPYLEGFAQNVAQASIIGDTISLNIPEGTHPSERTILNMTCISEDEVWNYPGVGGRNPEDKMNTGEGYAYWIQHLPGLSHDSPLFLIFNIHTQEEDVGKKHMVLFAVSPLINLQSGLLQLGSLSAQSSGAAVKLTRSVDIWGMTYIFELLLCKEL